MRKPFLPLICLVLLAFVSSTGAKMNPYATHAETTSTCTTASSNSDIKFFWRAQALDFSGTNGTSDYSAGDDIGETIGAAAINTDAALGNNGTNGMDCPTGDDYVFFNDDHTAVHDGGDYRVGFLFYANTLPSTQQRAWASRQGGADETYIWIMPDGDVNLLFENTGETTCNSLTTGTPISTGTTYWIEGFASVTDDDCGVYVYTYSDGLLQDSATDSQTISDLGTPVDFRFGGAGDYGGDYYVDLMIISTDPNTSLLDYRDDTAYNSCN